MAVLSTVLCPTEFSILTSRFREDSHISNRTDARYECAIRRGITGEKDVVTEISVATVLTTTFDERSNANPRSFTRCGARGSISESTVDGIAGSFHTETRVPIRILHCRLFGFSDALQYFYL